MTPLVEVDRLCHSYVRPRFLRAPVTVEAVRDVSLSIGHGETVGLVGESGSGKSTVARCILGLLSPTSGEVRLEGQPVGRRRGLGQRRLVQPVFQDPFSSLDPRQSVGASIEEPLAVHRDGTTEERRRRVADLLGQVGLDPALATRRPHALSGGQRQRVALARALALSPRMLLLDEPVSALDASVGARILTELGRLQSTLRLAMLFITHDLRIVRQLASRVAVMRQGQLVELAPTTRLFEAPRHPYTRALLAASELRVTEAPDDAGGGLAGMPLVEVDPEHWARV